MTIQTRSNNNSLPTALNSVLVAAAIGAIAIAAFTLRSGESNPPAADTHFFLAASGPVAEVSASELLAAGIAEHSAYFPRLAAVTNTPVRDLQAELAAGIAEHSAYFPRLAAVTNTPVRDAHAELAAGIAEHSAYFPPLAALTNASVRDAQAELATGIAEHSAYFPPLAAVTNSSVRHAQAELAAGIAEHSAYFPPLAAVTQLPASGWLAAEMAQHEALTEAYFGPATAPRKPFLS